MTEAQPTQPPAQPQQQATFQVEKLYVKDLSLEIPHAPQVFVEQAQPQIEVHINTGESQFSEGYYEVTVSATVTARAGERTLFLAEAVQAGIFALRNVPAAELGALLGIACPTILFPYLRETISELLLSPISFEQLYLQRLQQQGGESPRIEVAQ